MNTTSSLRCDGIVRRDFLHVGLMSALGLSLTDLLRLEASAATSKAKAKSCILIWLDGGPSHLDTFDPKPDAPVEIRGPFKTIGNIHAKPLEPCVVPDRANPRGIHHAGIGPLYGVYEPVAVAYLHRDIGSRRTLHQWPHGPHKCPAVRNDL